MYWNHKYNPFTNTEQQYTSDLKIPIKLQHCGQIKQSNLDIKELCLEISKTKEQANLLNNFLQQNMQNIEFSLIWEIDTECNLQKIQKISREKADEILNLETQLLKILKLTQDFQNKTLNLNSLLWTMARKNPHNLQIEKIKIDFSQFYTHIKQKLKSIIQQLQQKENKLKAIKNTIQKITPVPQEPHNKLIQKNKENIQKEQQKCKSKIQKTLQRQKIPLKSYQNKIDLNTLQKPEIIMLKQNLQKNLSKKDQTSKFIKNN